MRLKSTGLGATELFGELTSLEAKMSGVLMLVKIKKPVVWRVRTFLQPADLRAIVWRAVMPWNVFFVIQLKRNNPGCPVNRWIPSLFTDHFFRNDLFRAIAFLVNARCYHICAISYAEGKTGGYNVVIAVIEQSVAVCHFLHCAH